MIKNIDNNRMYEIDDEELFEDYNDYLALRKQKYYVYEDRNGERFAEYEPVVNMRNGFEILDSGRTYETNQNDSLKYERAFIRTNEHKAATEYRYPIEMLSQAEIYEANRNQIIYEETYQ